MLAHRSGTGTSTGCGFLRLLLLVLLLCSPAWSQQFTFTDYGVSSGLANLNATSLLQDRSGLVWAGTQSGVFTADGASFQKQKAFTAAGLEYIRALREDHAGRIWAVDGHHLVYWQQGEIHEVVDAHLNVLSHEVLDLLLPPDGSDSLYLLRAGELLYISSADQGLHWTVAAAFTPYVLGHHPELHNITSIAMGAQSIVWLGCGQAIFAFDPRHQSVRSFGAEQGVPAEVWSRLTVTRSGEVWARGQHTILFKPDAAPLFNRVSHLPDEYARDVRWPLLLEDPQGRMIVNLAEGVAIGGKNGWSVLKARNGLPEDEIENLLFDTSGALWLTSAGHGVLRWQGYGNWEGWTRKDGLSSNIVWSVAHDQAGRYWITTDKGLNQLNEGARSIIPAPGLTMRLFPIVVDSRSHIWTSDRSGTLYEFDPATKHTRVAAKDLDRVFSLHIDKQQRLWACSRKGLILFSREDGWRVPQPIDQRALAGTYAWSMAEGPDGTLWLATGRGLFRMDGQTWTSIFLPSLPEGTHNNFMLAAAHDGTLWLQSKQPYPLVHLKVNGVTATVIDHVSGSIIESDNITFVETDQRGWLWVGTDAGVYVFNGQRWIKYAAEDGLLWDDTDFHAFLADPDGSVWIGTSAGVSHLLHPQWLFDIQAPKVRLADISLSGQRITGASQAFGLIKPALTFHFLNTNYSRGSAVREKYKLDGEENEWEETEGSQVRVPSLAAGKYRLQVIAYDNRLQRESEVETIAFTILEPWWKRPWCLFIEALSGLLVLLAIWRLSVHILVARQTELGRLVALRTEELEAEKRELLKARSSLLEVMRRDALTGLLNRGAIFESLGELCEDSRSSGIPIAVVMADLDSFKRINDHHGHVVGDAVLRECAARIKSITRPNDMVGRYGGEELLILMPGLQPAGLKQRMEQLRASIAGEPVLHQQLAVNVSCSFGVTWFTGDSCTLESLISVADSALYKAKQNGRNRVEYAELVEA